MTWTVAGAPAAWVALEGEPLAHEDEVEPPRWGSGQTTSPAGSGHPTPWRNGEQRPTEPDCGISSACAQTDGRGRASDTDPAGDSLRRLRAAQSGHAAHGLWGHRAGRGGRAAGRSLRLRSSHLLQAPEPRRLSRAGGHGRAQRGGRPVGGRRAAHLADHRPDRAPGPESGLVPRRSPVRGDHHDLPGAMVAARARTPTGPPPPGPTGQDRAGCDGRDPCPPS